jgi:hypothetical protein
MGGYQNIVKIEEMRRKMGEKDYTSALKIVESIPAKKIKNVWDLNIMAEVYMENGRYMEAMQLLVRIYNKAKSRKVLFKLVQVSILRGDVHDAETYFEKYQKLVPQGAYNYIFRYKIGRIKREPIKVLINVLEGLKKVEYIDKWAYELVKLYYKAGMRDKCIRECSDIVLWFEEGSCVEKAKMLRAYCSGEIGRDTMMEELRLRTASRGKSPMDNPYRRPAREEIKPEGSYEPRVRKQSEKEPLDDEFLDKRALNESLDDGTLEEESLNENSLKEEEEPSNEKFLEEGPLNEVTFDEKSLEEEQEPLNEESLNKSAMDDRCLDDEPLADEVLDDKMVYNVTEDTALRNLDYKDKGKTEGEQEIERSIYNLIEEENMDESERILKQMSSELGFAVGELFGGFLHIKSVKKQIVKCLQSVLDKNTKSIQLLIMGVPKSGKSTLAKEIASFLYKTGKIKSPKVAKIKADKLNRIDIGAYRESLCNCCMVVENASDLKHSTIENVLRLVQYHHGKTAVVFEANDKTINNLFKEYPKLMDILQLRIHLKPYTKEDLTGFACDYFKKQKYYFDSEVQSILTKELYKMAKQNDPESWLENVYEIAKFVITAADIRTGKKFPNLAGQVNMNSHKELCILPEDFN